MLNKKRSFFERLTGSNRVYEEDEEEVVEEQKKTKSNWMEEENDEAELSVDVYETQKYMIIQTMIAGVKADDIEITVARDVIIIKGKREYNHSINEDSYFLRELYWGKFGRTISLPQEVEPEFVEATEKHGLLTIKIQKVDKDKKNTIKIKSI